MNNIADLLLQHPRPQQVVYSLRGHDYTIQQMIDWSQQAAHCLMQRGVQPGHTVVLCATENLSWISAFWALTTIGAVVIMLPDNIDPRSWRDITTRYDIDFVITDDTSAHSVTGIDIKDLVATEFDRIATHTYQPNDVVLCWASSGTSGDIKLIAHTMDSLLAGELGFQAYWREVGGEPAHGVYCPARASTSMGFCFTVLAPLMLQYRAVLTAGLTELRDLPGLVLRHRVQHLLLTPYVLDFVLRADPTGDLIGVLSVTSAADCLSNSVRQRFLQRFAMPVYNLYGSSEMLLISMNTHSPEEYSVGTVMQHVDAKIIDDRGQECDPGAVGTIQLHSASQFAGYHNDITTTRDVLRGQWVHTYDMGYKNAQGDLVLLGRANSCVKIRGRWTSLTAMEHQLLETCQVQDCVLLHSMDASGMPDITALIVPRHPNTDITSALDQNVVAKIARIHCVKEIPRTANMKKIRNLREIQRHLQLSA